MKETSKRIIDLIGVTKEYTLDSTVHRVLDNISFFIRENEFVTLLGPSGCGKTTLLRLIAGFDTLTSGDILFNGESIIDVPPYLRQVNTVFQRYALFPHLDVFENVAFGLKIRKLPKNQIEKKVHDMLKLVGLSGFERRPISKLSGGQQQRVAIARALVCEPSVLLLDEPLGALDLKFRQEMQLELKRMQKSLGITFVYVTHDQEEALTMSDTVIVMDTGVVQQIGTPEDVYNEPVNSFVADFIGESNITDAVMINDYHVRFAGREFECLDAGFGQNAPVKVVVRPEDILITKNYRPEDVIGTVESILFMGVHYAIRVRGQNGFEWLVHTIDQYEIGDTVGFNLEPNDIHVMRISKYDKAGDT